MSSTDAERPTVTSECLLVSRLRNTARMRIRGRVGFLVVVTAVFAIGGDAQAQMNETPFSNIYRRPSVNPMTMLGTGGGVGTGNPLVFQQLIQPRFDQERSVISQMQQGRRIGSLQTQVNALGRGAARMEETIRPTGHITTYQNLSHFYPSAMR
jgi:hypothetical protein